MRRAGLCESDVSVPSVRLSRYSIKTERASVMISLPSDSPMISASGKVWLVEKFARDHPERVRFLGSNGRFWRFFDLLAVVSPKQYNIGPIRLLLNTNRKSHGTKINDLGWPWIDLERPLCVFFNLHMCLSESTTKIWMKIDPYYQRQKCRTKIGVYSNIRFIWIFPGDRWTGAVKWQWGRRKWRFSLNMSLYLEYGAF